jgi:hypothetical protein
MKTTLYKIVYGCCNQVNSKRFEKKKIVSGCNTVYLRLFTVTIRSVFLREIIRCNSDRKVAQFMPFTSERPRFYNIYGPFSDRKRRRFDRSRFYERIAASYRKCLKLIHYLLKCMKNIQLYESIFTECALQYKYLFNVLYNRYRVKAHLRYICHQVDQAKTHIFS